MLSQKLVFTKSKNFTSSMWVLMPPTVPINHYGDSKNQQNRTARPILLFHANLFGRQACFEHSNFFKVKVLVPKRSELRQFTRRKGPAGQYTPWSGPPSRAQNPTTSFLTATTLIYAIGAGITAAAGTRLALQLFLVKGFKLYSFQLYDLKAVYCYILSLPPRVGIG